MITNLKEVPCTCVQVMAIFLAMETTLQILISKYQQPW